MGSDSDSDSDSNSEVILSGLGFSGSCGCEQRNLGFNKERRRKGGTGEEVIEDLSIIIIVCVLCVFRVV